MSTPGLRPDVADPPLRSRWKPEMAGVITALAIAVAAALSIGVFYFSIRDALLDDLRVHLRSAAETTAALIDPDHHRRLTDSSATGTPEYLSLSAPLAALLRANPDIRFAYSGHVRGDSMFFVLDGDRTPDRAYVTQADQPTPGEREVSRTARTVVEDRPSETAWGVGIRAYAPIPGSEGAYVGVTMDAGRYHAAVAKMFMSAALGLAIALMLALLGGIRAFRVERAHQRATAEILEARRRVTVAAEERLVMEKRLHASQKMEAVGTLAGGVAHDFNNLLTVMLGHAEMIAEDAKAGSGTAASAEMIRSAAVKARELVRRMLLFARPEAEPRIAVAIGSVIDETVGMLRATLPASIQVRFEPPREPVRAIADAPQLSQVLMNLGVNASQALPDDKGTITFALDRVRVGPGAATGVGLRPGSYARIVVRDDGIGMSPETRHRIFEPFFTTKPVGRGSGLGLAVADGVIRGHGGTIEVETALGAGTAFSLYLPAGEAAPAPTAAAKAELPKTGLGGGRRVLLVDDDPMVLGILSRILGRAGYRVASHGDPIEALALLEAVPDGFDLLVTDRAMPGLSGPEVAQRARVLNPGLPVMLLTGADQPADLDASRFQAVVVKPVDSAALLGVVDRVLAGARGPAPAPAA